ncbi:MAG: DUF4469 domain-containing protein [Hyphomicrobiales bacterium]
MKTRSIEFYNKENNLLSNKEEKIYLPKIIHRNKIDEATLISSAIENKGIPPEIFVASIDAFFNKVCDILGRGDTFNTRWINGSSIMKGKSFDEYERFNPSKNKSHKIKEFLSFSNDVRRKAFNLVNTEFVRKNYYEDQIVIAEVFQYFPYKKGEIRRGGTAKLRGKNLFCDVERGFQGLYLVSKKDKSEIQLEASDRKDGKYIIFHVPIDVEVGKYTVRFLSKSKNIEYGVKIDISVAIV